MNSMRTLFLMVALVTGILCFYFGNKKTEEFYRDNFVSTERIIDSGVNGGAVGMGIISGMSLVALGMTYIGRKEE